MKRIINLPPQIGSGKQAFYSSIQKLVFQIFFSKFPFSLFSPSFSLFISNSDLLICIPQSRNQRDNLSRGEKKETKERQRI